MHLCVHDNAKRVLYHDIDGDNSTLYNYLTVTRSLAPNNTSLLREKSVYVTNILLKLQQFGG